MEKDKKKTIPVRVINFTKSFEQLDEKEKKYAYYFYKASWEGAPIMIFNVSYESPIIFVVLRRFFSSFDKLSSMEEKVLEK